MSPQRLGLSLSYRVLLPFKEAKLDTCAGYPSPAQVPGLFPPLHPVSEMSAKFRRHPEVAACRLASGCRHSAQTTEGPYRRQASNAWLPHPLLPSSPAAQALLTVRGCAARATGRTGTQAPRGARRSAQLCSQRPASAGRAAGEPRGRSGQSRPRRRLEVRPDTPSGARGAPCWNPSGTAPR